MTIQVSDRINLPTAKMKSV